MMEGTVNITKFKDRPEWKRHDFVKRVAIKRQLRRAGIEIPESAMYDLRALRALRAA